MPMRLLAATFGALLLCLAFHPCSVNGQTCLTTFTVGSSNLVLAQCQSLAVQDATIAWTLDSTNLTLDVVFSGVAPSSSGWVGWGLNPTTPSAMGGTQAFVAFANSSGSSLLTYDVTTADKANGISPGPISLSVLNSQVAISGTAMTIYVKLQLAATDSLTMNHVWNRGPSVNGDIPATHASDTASITSFATIEMTTGVASAASSASSYLRNNHGVINTVAWGFLFPLGVMSARYLKLFSDPLWFYLHITCQCSAYILGLAGWATGLKLGNDSDGIVRNTHRGIGITLFVFSTLQLSALFLRPKKDHKLRKYWNVYHHSFGYTIIILGIINIFEGFNILQAEGKWRNAYVGVLAVLGAMAIILEVVTWSMVISKKKASSNNLGGGANGNGTKPTFDI